MSNPTLYSVIPKCADTNHQHMTLSKYSDYLILEWANNEEQKEQVTLPNEQQSSHVRFVDVQRQTVSTITLFGQEMDGVHGIVCLFTLNGGKSQHVYSGHLVPIE